MNIKELEQYVKELEEKVIALEKRLTKVEARPIISRHNRPLPPVAGKTIDGVYIPSGLG